MVAPQGSCSAGQSGKGGEDSVHDHAAVLARRRGVAGWRAARRGPARGSAQHIELDQAVDKPQGLIAVRHGPESSLRRRSPRRGSEVGVAQERGDYFVPALGLLEVGRMSCSWDFHHARA